MARDVVTQVLGARDVTADRGEDVDWLALLEQQLRHGLPMRAADALKAASLSLAALETFISLGEEALTLSFVSLKSEAPQAFRFDPRTWKG